MQSKGKKRQVGWFPASYVKLMESSTEKAQSAAQDAKVEGPKFRALFPYTSQNEDELSFQVHSHTLLSSTRFKQFFFSLETSLNWSQRMRKLGGVADSMVLKEYFHRITLNKWNKHSTTPKSLTIVSLIRLGKNQFIWCWSM